MPSKPQKSLQDICRERLEELLDKLADGGLTQQQIATRAGVPPQYLSDVRRGRRGLTELFARRLGEEFRVSYLWLRGGEGPMETAQLAGPGTESRDASEGRPATLPVLCAPAEGDPKDSPLWDGSLLEITGVAAAAAGRSRQPYVLRLDADDPHGRLRRGDLILVSQEIRDRAEIGVLKTEGRLVLARRQESGRWQNLATGQLLTSDAKAIGSGLAILWASL